MADRADFFTLAVTARPEHVAWIRTFAAAVASAHDIEPDDVADVRLAVSELSSAIARSAPGTDLELAVREDDDRLSFSLRPCTLGDHPDDDPDPWDIVCELFDDARLVEGHASFSVILPVGP